MVAGMADTARHRIEPYLNRLFGYAVCLCGERELARDLTQEAVVKALAARTVPTDEAAYRAWLFTILRNLFIDRARREGRAPDLSAPELPAEPPAESWQIWRSDDHLLNALTVKLALAKLRPAHREIIALVDIVGFSYAEAAALLSLPLGTVMSRLSRAREALLGVVVDNNVSELPRRARGDAT